MSSVFCSASVRLLFYCRQARCKFGLRIRFVRRTICESRAVNLHGELDKFTQLCSLLEGMGKREKLAIVNLIETDVQTQMCLHPGGGIECYRNW